LALENPILLPEKKEKKGKKISAKPPCNHHFQAPDFKLYIYIYKTQPLLARKTRGKKKKKKKNERNSAKPYQKKRNKTKPFIFGQRVTEKKKEMMSV
jgi:hypothetical protein